MAGTRECDYCGAVFWPRREHGRFCSADCRIAWNRAAKTDLAIGAHALQWSITAMGETTEKLRLRTADRRRAIAVIDEAVWRITIVDATLVRYHPDAYDRVLGAQPPAQRQQIEETLAGLRSARNRMGRDISRGDFIGPQAGRDGPVAARIADWTWNTLPAPALSSPPPPGQEWEMSRFRAYQARLAGHPVGEVFGRAAEFLRLAAAEAELATSQAD